jgi:hypothetical protein
MTPFLGAFFLSALCSLRAPPEEGANPVPSVHLVLGVLCAYLRVSASPRQIETRHYCNTGSVR